LLIYYDEHPIDQPALFGAMLMATALFIPFASPNVLSTIYDISLPEVRFTANAVESFIESAGAALAPLISGMIADATSLKSSILIICLVAWALCFIFFFGAIYFVPRDINALHAKLRQRAEAAQPKAV
jgi:fucose permease